MHKESMSSILFVYTSQDPIK